MSAIDRYLPFGLTSDLLLILLAAAAAFASVMAVWYGLIEKDVVTERARMLRARREELRGHLVSAKPRQHRRESFDFMSRVVNHLKLLQSTQTNKLTEKLWRAGVRSRDALVVFLFFKLVMPVVVGFAAFALVYSGGMGDLAPTMRLLSVAGAILFGFFLPDIYVANAATKRQQALQKGLPDGLDLLVICAEAGLSLDAALERVANEIGGSSPELADELALTSVELGFLPDRRQALANLAKRADLASIRGVVNTLSQTEKYGTPLAQSLRVLSREFRDQRMMKAEEKAARLPATLTVPMIVFILPTLFIVLIGPAMLSVYDNIIKG
jgi:tight adherence protein C